jgi:hypothetical protein
MPGKKRSLDLREAIDFQRREWRVQRIGWIAIAAVLLLGIAGLFGNGPLSRASAVDGPLHVEYQRFVHNKAPTTLSITLRDLKSESIRLAIDRQYLDAVPIEHVRPLPIRTESSGNDVIFEFAVANAPNAHISLDSRPQTTGFAHGAIRLQHPERGAVVHFRQLVYP